MNEKKYLVGYEGNGQVRYGKDSESERILVDGSFQWAEPMTLNQAKRYVNKINKTRNQGRPLMKIFKLTRVLTK